MNDILLLVQKCAHTFSFYDLDTKAALKHVVLPNFPHEFTVDVNERFATSASSGSRPRGRAAMTAITGSPRSISSNARIRACSTRPYYRPHGMASDRDGRLYAMSEAHDMLLVFDEPTRQPVPNLPCRPAA